MGSASFTVYQEFDRLLEEQSPMESYVEWLDTMVDRCVVKVGRAEGRGSRGSQGVWLSLWTQSELADVLSIHRPLGLQGGDLASTLGGGGDRDRTLNLLFLSHSGMHPLFVPYIASWH